jgi:hypothetical protein
MEWNAAIKINKNALCFSDHKESITEIQIEHRKGMANLVVAMC